MFYFAFIYHVLFKIDKHHFAKFPNQSDANRKNKNSENRLQQTKMLFLSTQQNRKRSNVPHFWFAEYVTCHQSFQESSFAPRKKNPRPNCCSILLLLTTDFPSLFATNATENKEIKNRKSINESHCFFPLAPEISSTLHIEWKRRCHHWSAGGGGGMEGFGKNVYQLIFMWEFSAFSGRELGVGWGGK